jgi:hypothetical protein
MNSTLDVVVTKSTKNSGSADLSTIINEGTDVGRISNKL